MPGGWDKLRAFVVVVWRRGRHFAVSDVFPIYVAVGVPVVETAAIEAIVAVLFLKGFRVVFAREEGGLLCGKFARIRLVARAIAVTSVWRLVAIGLSTVVDRIDRHFNV
jgi:hypothetical protein